VCCQCPCVYAGVFETFVSMKLWNQFENKIHRKNLQPFNNVFIYLAYFYVPNWRYTCKQNALYFLQNRQSFLSNRPNSHSRHTRNTCSAPIRQVSDLHPAKSTIAHTRSANQQTAGALATDGRGVFETFVSMKLWNQFENKIHRKNLQPFNNVFIYLAYFYVPNW
jgi:enterochelin esterase-like enzyme